MIETRTAPMYGYTATASTALVLLCLAAGGAQAQAVNCDWYADTALKQQQQNEQRKCGFSGPEWGVSRQVHVAWCGTQAPDRWRAMAQKRAQMLAGCKK
jgi:hypothetical protein